MNLCPHLKFMLQPETSFMFGKNGVEENYDQDFMETLYIPLCAPDAYVLSFKFCKGNKLFSTCVYMHKLLVSGIAFY